MCDTSLEPALGYMELVPDRTAATLLLIIKAHVRPGTSDEEERFLLYDFKLFSPSFSIVKDWIKASILKFTHSERSKSFECQYKPSSAGLIPLHPIHCCR